MKKLFLLLSVFILTSCGGGPLPDNLRIRYVVVDKLYPQKEILIQRDRIGLIERIFHYKRFNVFTAVGHLETCSFNSLGQIQACGNDLSALNFIPKIIKTETGARFDIGGDNYREWLTTYKDGFAIKDHSGSNIGIFRPPTDYWYRAAVSSSEPHIILVSTDKTLFVLNNKLRKLIKLDTPDIESPLHVVDGALLNVRGKELIASLFTGRGGWYRSILFIHNMKGKILYHEILNRYMSIMPIHTKTYAGFMLGGHGRILLYKL